LFDVVYYEERASKQSKQAKTEILMQKPSYLQAQRTDGRKWTFGGEEEKEEDAADGREPPRCKRVANCELK
jgi:hypothetical protein